MLAGAHSLTVMIAMPMVLRVMDTMATMLETM
jgi:hypothetical protein